jgi:hypothetical protein
MAKKQFLMKMDKNHPLEVHSSCKTCGGESDGVGYLCGSDEDGNGFVLWIEDQEVYDIVAKVIGQSS